MGEYVAPRSELERTIADIWLQLLPIDQVGILDNFFELGGHSLLATRVISRVREKLHVDLSVKALFDSPTVEQLAICVQREHNAQASRETLWTKTVSQDLSRQIAEMDDSQVLQRIAEIENDLSNGNETLRHG